MINAARSSAPALVLLVERDPALRDLLRTAFEDEGYRVQPAAQPPTPRDIAHLRPDMLVISIDRDAATTGWQLIEEIKASPQTAHLPIVVCSGEGAIVAQQDVRLRSEAAAILVKPFSLDDLLPVVEMTLARREMFHAVGQLVAEPPANHALGSIGF